MHVKTTRVQWGKLRSVAGGMAAALLGSGLLLLSDGLHAATLVADFRFHGGLSNSVPGGSDLVYPCPKNMQRNTAGDALDLSVDGVATFKASTGFMLGTSNLFSGLPLSGSNYTVAIRVKLNPMTGWLPLAYGSPNNQNNDDGWYEHDGKISMWNNAENSLGDGSLTSDAWFQVAYAIKPNGTKIDIAGVLGTGAVAQAAVYTAQNNAGHGMAIGDNDQRIVFFRGWYNDVTAGTVDRIQVYQGTMSTNEMRALDLATEDNGGQTTAPDINTSGASGIGAESATLNADLISTGGLSTAVIVYWGPEDGGTNAVPPYWANEVHLGPCAAGPVSTTLTGLTVGAQYFYAFCASNAAGSAWGGTLSFRTLGPPMIVTTAAPSPTVHAVTMNGVLVSTGAAPTTVRLFWGTSDGGAFAAGWENTNDFGGCAPGPFTLNLDGLPSATRYYYCYYATNQYGESWGAPSVSIKTLPDVSIYASATATIPIPDAGNGGINGQAVTSTIYVAEDFKIGSDGVIVTFTNLHHSYVSDLIFSLVGPDGTQVDFFRLYPPNRPGGFLQNNHYSFADGYLAPGPYGANWPSGVYAVTNSHAVVSLNAAFVGKHAQGTWQLLATDIAGGDVGSFGGWTLGLAKPKTGSLLIVK